MTDEAADRTRWEAAMLRNQYPNYGVDLQAQHENPPNVNNDSMKENYTLLRDAYGNVVKVYGLNLENQNYELFNSSPNPSLPFLPNMTASSAQSHSNYQPTQQRNFQQEFYTENRMHYGGENSFNGNNVQQPPPPNKGQGQGQNNMQSMYSSNPIINQLVGNWTPGTSIYGDCFMNNNATDNLQRANETHHQAYEQTQNMANNQASLNDNMENSMPVPHPQLKKKQRIIAEVKPMRMSYSDVLSKNVLTEMEPNPPNTTSYPNNNSSSANISNQQMNGKNKKQSQARSPIQFEKRSPVTVTPDDKFRKSLSGTMNGEKIIKPSNDQKASNPVMKEAKETKGTSATTPSETKMKKGSKNREKNGKNKAKSTQNASKPTTDKFGRDDENYHLIPDDSQQDKETENNYENMYSVNYDRISTKGMSQSSSSSHKKSKHSVNLTSSGGRTATKQDKFYSKRSQKNHKSQRYQMLEKFWIMWLEYITKFVLWLWSLVSDVVYLSFGIMWDKLVVGYNHAQQFVGSMWMEIGSRPHMWIKSLWSRVNSKLERWAFWRKIFTKKPEEPVKDYYKDGKLPTTADEAMYSLLNCKGKDAYRWVTSFFNRNFYKFMSYFSILGVTPDCQQEQIRKHFHKIALLVHPDKNKQIGTVTSQINILTR